MIGIHQASHKEAGNHHPSFSRHYHLLFLNPPYCNTLLEDVEHRGPGVDFSFIDLELQLFLVIDGSYHYTQAPT